MGTAQGGGEETDGLPEGRVVDGDLLEHGVLQKLGRGGPAAEDGGGG